MASSAPADHASRLSNLRSKLYIRGSLSLFFALSGHVFSFGSRILFDTTRLFFAARRASGVEEGATDDGVRVPAPLFSFSFRAFVLAGVFGLARTPGTTRTGAKRTIRNFDERIVSASVISGWAP